MKRLIMGVLFALSFVTAAWAADTRVKGYTKKDGTYVAPHYRTSPNATTSDNYSTRGNVNPYTGELGTKPNTRPSYTVPTYTTPSYGSPKPASSSTFGAPSGSKPGPSCTSILGC